MAKEKPVQKEDTPNTIEKDVKPPNKDPFEDCLRVALTFFGIHADITGLLSKTPSDSAKRTLDDAVFVVDKLGLETDRIQYKASQLKKLDLPAICLFKNGLPYIDLPEKLHDGKIYIPGKGIVERPRNMNDLFTGEGIIIHPAKPESGEHAQHMKKGHALDWFWRPIVSFWTSYTEVIIASFLINLMALALPLFTMNVYDRVIINFAQSTLFVLTVGVAMAIIFDFCFKTIRSYILERIAQKLGTKYSFDLMERLLLLKVPEVSFSVGERSNLFRELQGIRDFYAGRLVPALVDLPFFALFLFIIHLIAPPLIWVPLGGATLILLVNLIVSVPVNRSTEEYFATMQDKSTILIEILSGTQVIKMFDAVGGQLFKWKISATRSDQAARKHRFMTSMAANISLLITHLVHVTIVFSGAYYIQDGSLTIGGLIACTILSGRTVAPVMNVAGVFAQLKQSNDVLKAIDKIFRLPYEDESDNRKTPKGPFKGAMELQNVSYQYEGQARPAMKQANLKISAGERVGLIGRTGAGKSTIAKLLAGFIDPQEGSVLLDNFSLGKIPSSELHRSIGYVPQDSFFFSGSIQNNILLNNEPVDEKVFKTAIDVSGLNLVLHQTGQGLDMEVGENGCRLSGGQKQAISLARTLVRNPSVLIFDEPTTGMDNVLENRIKNSMAEFLEGRTFIMVTHRTSLLSLVDRLILVDGGKIIADGPRDDVLKQISS